MDEPLPKVEDLDKIMARVFSFDMTPQSTIRRIEDAITGHAPFLLSEYERLIASLYRDGQYFMFLQHNFPEDCHHFFDEAQMWKDQWNVVLSDPPPDEFQDVYRAFLRLKPKDLRNMERVVRSADCPDAEKQTILHFLKDNRKITEPGWGPTSEVGEYNSTQPVARAYSPNWKNATRPTQLTKQQLTGFRNDHLSPRKIKKGGNKKNAEKYNFWVDEVGSSRSAIGEIQMYPRGAHSPKIIPIAGPMNWLLELRALLKKGFREYTPAEYLTEIYAGRKPRSWKRLVAGYKKQAYPKSEESLARDHIRDHFRAVVEQSKDRWAGSPAYPRYFAKTLGSRGARRTSEARYGLNSKERFLLIEAVKSE